MSQQPSQSGASSHVVVYAVGNAGVAAVNFVFFAVYARVLRPEDYGAMSLLLTVTSIVSMLGLMGMNNAVQRFFFDVKDTAARDRIWSSGFTAAMVLTTVFAALFVGSAGWLTRYDSALAGSAAVLAVACAIPQGVVMWLQDRARLQFRPLAFAGLALMQAALSGGAGFLFVVQWGWGVRGFFAANLAAAVMTAIGGFAIGGSVPRWAISSADIRRLLRFGAPFVPAGLFMWASTAGLRWLLAHFRGLEEVGFLDVAWKLAAPVWMLNAAIGQSFGPYAFRMRAEAPDYRVRLVDTFHLIGVTTMGASCLVIVLAREVCAVVVPVSYAAAALPCAVLAFGFYFSALHQVTALGIAFAERSHLVAVGWALAAAVCLGSTLALVPRYGANGAAWCVVLAYAGLTLFYAINSQRLHPLPFRIGPLLVQAGAGLGTLAVAYFFRNAPPSLAGVALKLAWWLGIAVVLLRWGGVSPGRMRSTLRQLTRRSRGLPSR